MELQPNKEPSKEALVRLLNGTLDGHARLSKCGPQYLDGIKHVRDLFEETFEQVIKPDELLEFCVNLICTIQPEEPRLNRFLSDLEKGMLSAAYFLYTAMYPLEYRPTRSNG